MEWSGWEWTGAERIGRVFFLYTRILTEQEGRGVDGNGTEWNGEERKGRVVLMLAY